MDTDATLKLFIHHLISSLLLSSSDNNLTWEAAPACPKTVSKKTAVNDKSGKPWGWFNGKSCAFKPSGRSLLESANATLLTLTTTSNIPDDTPAALKGPTKTTATVGGVKCQLDSVPDATTNTVHSV